MKKVPATNASMPAGSRIPGRSRAAAKALERVMQLIFLICGLIAVAFVLVISIYLILFRPAGHPGDRAD